MRIDQIPAVAKQLVPTARLPVNYEAAKKALAECVQIDECLDWSNKAEAIASYARQIKDEILKEAAVRIKMRARVRIGELLLEVAPAKGGQGREGVFAPGTLKNPNSRSGVARSAGIPRMLAGACMAMARVPAEDRDRLIEQSPPITPSELAVRGRLEYGRDNRRFKAGETYKLIVTHNWQGLGALTKWMEAHPPAQLAGGLSAEEAEHLRPHMLKISEWADELEQRLPRPSVVSEEAKRC